MLSAAVNILEKNLKDLLEQYSEPAAYDGAYEAYLSQYTPPSGDVGNFLGPTGPGSMHQAKSDADKYAEAFSKAFSKKIAQDMSGPLAKAIHDFVKEIGITIVVKGSITSPMGPCTGTILPTDVTIS